MTRVIKLAMLLTLVGWTVRSGDELDTEGCADDGSCRSGDGAGDRGDGDGSAGGDEEI